MEPDRSVCTSRVVGRTGSTALALLLASLLALPWPGVVIAQDDAQAPTFSTDQLEQIVAPIALYPDALIAQVLMASTYPLEIVEADRYAKAHPGLEGKALEDAMQTQTWDDSVKSIVAFPQVLTMMSEKLDWTQKLGDAFLAQQSDLMVAVQVLRGKAKAQGNLESSKQQNIIVEQEPQGSQTIIKIEPADPQIVYVPTYNPTVVYGAWPYPSYPPYSYYPPGYTAAASVLSFGVGLAVGSALWGGTNWGWGGYGHGHNDVDINVNRYNNFNRTNIQNNNWQHNSAHRKGVQYRDQSVQNRYGKGDRGNVQSREAFRGRAEQGRQEIARDGGKGIRNDLGKQGGAGDKFGGGGLGKGDGGGINKGGGAGLGNRDGGGLNKGSGAGLGKGDGGGLAKHAGAGKGGAGGAGNRGAGLGSGGGNHGKAPGAFHGQGSGQQIKRDSNRGRASQQSARASGSHGGGGGGSKMRSGGGGGGGHHGGGGGGGGRGGGGGGGRRGR